MKTFIISVSALVLLMLFAGCISQTTGPIQIGDGNEPQLIGGDKDEHGCLIAAGYSWCELAQKCLRVWEEPCTGSNAGTQLANPASVNCTDHNGSLEIIDTNEGQIGICTLPNGKQCEEWAYYRKECGIECIVNTTDKTCCKNESCVKLFDDGLPSACSDGNLPGFSGCDANCNPIAECKE
ncbi:MAG: DUF333 domain-containing protein [archaeon]